MTGVAEEDIAAINGIEEVDDSLVGQTLLLTIEPEVVLQEDEILKSAVYEE